MVNTLEKPAQWQSEFFVAWVGEADHEAALAQPNEWWGPIAETLKAQGHYAQVSLFSVAGMFRGQSNTVNGC